MDGNRQFTKVDGRFPIALLGRQAIGIDRHLDLKREMIPADVAAGRQEIKSVLLDVHRNSMSICIFKFQISPRVSASRRSGWPYGSLRSKSCCNDLAFLACSSCSRVLRFKCRWPLMSEFWSESAQPRNWREQDSPTDFRSAI